MKLIDRLICITGCAAVAALAFLGLATGAFGHDPKHHQPNPVLADAKNRLNGSCCDGTDYTIADGWEHKDGKYRVLIGGVWLDVPPSAYVENVRNPYTEAIVWLYSYSSTAMPASASAASRRGSRYERAARLAFAPTSEATAFGDPRSA